MSINFFTGTDNRKPQDDWDPHYWLRLLSGSTESQLPANGSKAAPSVPAGRPAEIIGQTGYPLYR